MKNSLSTLKNKIRSSHVSEDIEANRQERTNINVLLNRVKLNKKKENRKKIYFSAAVSTGLILFGILVF